MHATQWAAHWHTLTGSHGGSSGGMVQLENRNSDSHSTEAWTGRELPRSWMNLKRRDLPGELARINLGFVCTFVTTAVSKLGAMFRESVRN